MQEHLAIMVDVSHCTSPTLFEASLIAMTFERDRGDVEGPPFVVMMLAATASLVYYVIVV
jgi:hypothetical protein